ncbi:MAG: ferrous iron transporter B [Planctomycetota bacterium]|nr:ferrous iron transporter B [Planctomycetota bacterium]
MADRILLVGNPNVGKSALFHRLTGVHVICSNYPGTTVEYTEGSLNVGGERVQVLDVPGTYSLTPSSKGEEVATHMIAGGGTIINVVDATNIERNLLLTLNLLDRGLPVIVALNMWDDAAHRGIRIDAAALSKELGAPVVPTVAVTGEGVRELVGKLAEAAGAAAGRGVRERSDGERWAEIGRILAKVQSLEHRHHTFAEWLGDLSVQPLPAGIPIAVVVLAATFAVVRLVGEGLIALISDPFFEGAWLPLMERLDGAIGGGILGDILIGRRVDGEIHLRESFGVLTTGVYVEFGMVLPYIAAFYLAVGALEDSGYLPRLAVMLDSVMHRLGLHGWAIIPSLLGLGCNVPGILATRMLESGRERLIAATLISTAIPCVSLQAMIWGLIGERGVRCVAIIYVSMLLAWLVLGRLLNLLLKGRSPELLMEIPPYRFPPIRVAAEKLAMRLVQFVREATPLVLGGILLANVLMLTGAFDLAAAAFGPILSAIWGLPPEAAVPLMVGVLRKDVAVGMLETLGLGDAQMVVATVGLAMTFPCAASFIVMLRELGWKGFLKSVGIMLATAAVAGAALNLSLKAAGME